MKALLLVLVITGQLASGVHSLSPDDYNRTILSVSSEASLIELFPNTSSFSPPMMGGPLNSSITILSSSNSGGNRMPYYVLIVAATDVSLRETHTNGSYTVVGNSSATLLLSAPSAAFLQFVWRHVCLERKSPEGNHDEGDLFSSLVVTRWAVDFSSGVYQGDVVVTFTPRPTPAPRPIFVNFASSPSPKQDADGRPVPKESARSVFHYMASVVVALATVTSKISPGVGSRLASSHTLNALATCGTVQEAPSWSTNPILTPIGDTPEKDFIGAVVFNSLLSCGFLCVFLIIVQARKGFGSSDWWETFPGVGVSFFVFFYQHQVHYGLYIILNSAQGLIICLGLVVLLTHVAVTLRYLLHWRVIGYRFSPLYSMYVQPYQWFGILELGLQFVVGMSNAFSVRECDFQRSVCILVAVVHFLCLCIVRPLRSWWETVVLLCLDLLLVSAAALEVKGLTDPAQVVLTIVNAVLLFNTIFLIMWLVGEEGRLAEAQRRREAAAAAAGPPPNPLEIELLSGLLGEDGAEQRRALEREARLNDALQQGRVTLRQLVAPLRQFLLAQHYPPMSPVPIIRADSQEPNPVVEL